MSKDFDFLSDYYVYNQVMEGGDDFSTNPKKNERRKDNYQGGSEIGLGGWIFITIIVVLIIFFL